MQRSRHNSVIAGFGAALLAVGLAGCTAWNGLAPATTAATTTATPAPSAEATTPPPTAPVALADCDTMLTEDGYADLAASNLTEMDFTLGSWHYPLVHTMAADGVLCHWGRPASDSGVEVGQLAMDEATWETTRAQLEAEGYVADDATIPGFIDGPDVPDESFPHRGFVYRDGVLYYVSYVEFAGFLPAVQG